MVVKLPLYPSITYCSWYCMVVKLPLHPSITYCSCYRTVVKLPLHPSIAYCSCYRMVVKLPLNPSIAYCSCYRMMVKLPLHPFCPTRLVVIRAHDYRIEFIKLNCLAKTAFFTPVEVQDCSGEVPGRAHGY